MVNELDAQSNVAVKTKTMDVKKNQFSSPKVEENAPVTTGKVVDFVGEIKSELHKISWTSPEELKVYTKIVVGMTLFLGLGIYLTDLIIQSFLHGLNLFLRWIS